MVWKKAREVETIYNTRAKYIISNKTETIEKEVDDEHNKRQKACQDEHDSASEGQHTEGEK